MTSSEAYITKELFAFLLKEVYFYYLFLITMAINGSYLNMLYNYM